MDNIEWHCKVFAELTVTELYEILKLRSEVFVVEQNCVYLDADNKDVLCHHLFTLQNGTVAAYSRLLPPNISFTEASIGRVLTNSLYRGSGLGIALMKQAIDSTLHLFNTESIKIGAQLYLKSFYERLAFVQCSEQYDEDGIPHIEMLFKKNISSNL